MLLTILNGDNKLILNLFKFNAFGYIKSIKIAD